MSAKQIIKRPGLFVFVVLIAAIMAFTQFYDIEVSVKKKSRNLSEALKSAQQKTTSKKKEENTNLDLPQINPQSLKVDLKELTEQDLASVRAFLKFKKIKDQIIPSGVPALYGDELTVNFNRVQESMNKLVVFDPTYGLEDKKIILRGKDKERYIRVASQTACEYCCGARSLVFNNGQAACGCAHSIAMRGLAAYLIKNHPQLSDQKILTELNNWKKVFFPKQSLTAALQKLKESGDKDIDQVLQEFPDFLPQMVGGC